MVISLGQRGNADCMLNLEHKGVKATFYIEGLGWRILEELQLQADGNSSYPKYPVSLIYRTSGGLLHEMLEYPEKFDGKRL